MRRNRDVITFVVWFLVLSVTLGWLYWTAGTPLQSGALNVMLAIQVVSAMLASRGFSWRRKVVYASVTAGVYLTVGVAYDTLGLGEIALRQVAQNPDSPSIPLLLYLTFLTAFPLAMLVFFVGRTPSLLWSKRAG